MRTLYIIALFTASVFTASCRKSAEDKVNEAIPAGTELTSGTFVSNSKNTSGTVRVIRGADNVVRLVFENLNTGNGPDVRVWLSPNTSANTYQEVGPLKAVSGNFSYDLGSNIDYTVNNRVLIWCVDVNVLFGHAVLQ